VSAGPRTSTMFYLQQIDHVALTVTDVERSLHWYRSVLGLERRYQDAWNVPVVVCAGSACIALVRGEPTGGPRHLAFKADLQNFEQARADLQRFGIAFEFEDHGIAHSIYFRDPDGHVLEITSYDVD